MTGATSGAGVREVTAFSKFLQFMGIENPKADVQTPSAFSFTNFTFPSTPPSKSSSSILLREGASAKNPLNPTQTRMNRWAAQMIGQVGKPSSFALLAAGGALTNVPGLGLLSEGSAWISRKAFVQPNWRFSSLVFLAAGCEGIGGLDGLRTPRDGGLPDAGDGGQPLIDVDGDHVPLEEDCNDLDPNVFPLLGEGRLVEIRASTKVCPGTYHGFTLAVSPGMRDIDLDGTGVILDGNVAGQKIAAQAIRIRGAQNVEVFGFQVQNYDEPVEAPGMLRVESSNDVSLHSLEFFADGGNWPVRIKDSNRVQVLSVNTHTHSDRALRVEASRAVTLQDSNFISTPPYDYQPFFALVYFEGGKDNVLVGCKLLASQANGLIVQDSSNFQGLQNFIQTNSKNGILIDAAKSGYYRDNQVTGNQQCGLFIQYSAKGNTFWRNDFSNNMEGAYCEGLEGSVGANSFMENVPQP